MVAPLPRIGRSQAALRALPGGQAVSEVAADSDEKLIEAFENGDRQVAAKLYDKWFMQPIAPANTRVNLPASDATKAAWGNPTDKPLEEYAQP